MHSEIDDKEIQRLLNQHFGYLELRPGQKEVISALSCGDSAAAIFPTGSGKSLCYQLPALFLDNLTLVVSPLLALMKDQIDFLNAHNIPAASIDSSQTYEQSIVVKQGIKNGSIKILMISVERLKNERFREFIKSIPISLMVIDEAHCISEWGHNFRPDYIKLPAYQKQFSIPQVLLLTATATTQVISDMTSAFSIKKNNIITTGFYRPNLKLSVKPCATNDKLNQLENYLSSHLGEPAIVYVTLQNTTEQISQSLNNKGIKAAAYHAGLNGEKRVEIQEKFMNSEINCVVATIAFGMGIDKNNIRHIIHYDLPKSIENYAQEIGRAGRDGKTANCLLLGNINGLNTLENFVYGDTPELSAIKSVLSELQNSTDATTGLWEIMLNRLSSRADIRLLPLKTLLVYLEIKGIIHPKYSYYAEYKFKLLITENELLQKFEGERLSFVTAILKHSNNAKIWTTVDIDNILQHYKSERQRIITALEYLHEKQWILLESKQITEVYQLLNQQFDLEQVAEDLYQHFKQKEQSEIKRIHDMLQLFQSDQCISQQLINYFSDHSLVQGCGHCSVCLGKYQAWSEHKPTKTLSTTELQQAIEPLNKAVMDKFSTPASKDLICRYLCGISSPWLTKIRARSLGHFGQYEEYSYALIKTKLE